MARYRSDFAEYPGDTRFERLVENLRRESPELREWWARYDLAGESDGRKELFYPEVGSLILEHTTLRPPADPDPKVIAYTPADEEDASRLAEVLRINTERLPGPGRSGDGESQGQPSSTWQSGSETGS